MQKTVISRFSELGESNSLKNTQFVGEELGSEIAPPLIDPSMASGCQASDLAHYIAHMTGSMANMARMAHLDSLAYFLEMAAIEARTMVKKKSEDSF